jgi:predicted RNA binding protein YcfA (HicA-like mRNA interferase family)
MWLRLALPLWYKWARQSRETEMSIKKTLERIVSGASDANIAFDDLCHVLRRLGFDERIRGSHHIFTNERVAEILNLQPRSDGKAKPYQVKQVRQVIVHYKLGGLL